MSPLLETRAGQSKSAFTNTVSLVSSSSSQPFSIYDLNNTLAALNSANGTKTKILVDSSGNIYIFGAYGSKQKDNVVKLDRTGAVVWQKEFFLTGQYYVHNLFDAVIDSSDSIYILGSYYGASTYPPSQYVTVRRIDTSGNLIWERQIYASASTTGNQPLEYSINLDPSGNVYIVGSLKTSSQTTSGNPWTYLAKLTGTTGAVVWEKTVNNGTSGKIAISPITGYAYFCSNTSNSGIKCEILGLNQSTGSPIVGGTYTMINTGMTDHSDVRINSSTGILYSAGVSSTTSGTIRVMTIDPTYLGSSTGFTGYPLCFSIDNTNAWTTPYPGYPYYSQGTSAWNLYSGQSAVYITSAFNTYFATSASSGSAAPYNSALMLTKFDGTGAVSWCKKITFDVISTSSSYQITCTGITEDEVNKTLYVTVIAIMSTGYKYYLFTLPTDGHIIGTYALNGVNITIANQDYLAGVTDVWTTISGTSANIVAPTSVSSNAATTTTFAATAANLTSVAATVSLGT